ncbi:MAG: SDR family oxidoreductase [Chloroflexi bacterium]|nr:SDR family oxidoreductase [Chloroflexota bacterium]
MMTQPIAQLFDLSGKGAIVTGGAIGMGKAIAFRLAEAGASVMIADINLEAASQAAEEIKSGGGKVQAIRADAQSAADARKVTQATAEAFGRLDILVNNAGVYPASLVLDMSEEIWDKVLDTNLKGLFFYSQAAAQQMIEAGHGGKIINIASLEALHPSPMHAHYAASKGGVLMATKALALELAPHNVLVNAIAPGIIWTPGLDALLHSFYEPAGMTLEEFVPTFVSRVALGRMGEPDDIAKVVLFLASGAADYMTGETLVVDGGYLLT